LADDVIADQRVDPSAAGNSVGGSSTVSEQPSRWRGPRRWLIALGMVVVCAALAFLYFRQSLTAQFTSDGAGDVLQGQAMLDGNPLLRGWWTTDVSFYTTELPEYALVTAIRGVAPNVQHICGALTYMLTVLLTALVARGRERGAAGLCRAGVAVAITLALTVTGSAGLFLEDPNHAGTAVPVLLFLLILDYADPRASNQAGLQLGGWLRRRWVIPVAACAVLTVAEIGDELTLAAAIVPLAAVCAIRLVAGRRNSGEQSSEQAGKQRRAPASLEWLLLAAGVVAAALAWLANHLIRALGGFDLQPVNGVGVAPLSRIPANASMLWQGIVILFGANQPGTPHQPQQIKVHPLLVAMADLHVVGLVLVLVGLVVGGIVLAGSVLAGSVLAGPVLAGPVSGGPVLSGAAFRLRGDRLRADRVTQVLVAAIVVLLAFGVFSTLLRSRSYIHEVAVLMPLGAALAARVLVPLAADKLPGRLRTASVVALGVWVALAAAEVGYTATWPATPPAQQAVASWLASQHEYDGLSGYWQATSTTVTSGGKVLVAGITLPGQSLPGQSVPGQLMSNRADAYQWESSAAWYQPTRHDATFVIALTDPGASGGGLSGAAARATFGAPAAQHQIGDEVIMLYNYNLLTRVNQ
jgi:hypothetical protein